jgi:D-3-phosphoglycerate dehydrogenase
MRCPTGSPTGSLDPLTAAVLLTDHPWPSVEVESRILESAGYRLVDAPAQADSHTLARLAHDVVGILTCWAEVTAEVIDAAPELRAISRLGVGLDNIDLTAAARRDLTVTRVPDYCVEEVSDHVVALVTGWARGIWSFDRSLRAGRWEPGLVELRRVRDLTVGIVGAGHTGARTGEKFSALGCTVIVDDHHAGRDGPDPDRDGATGKDGPVRLQLPELFATCDVVSLHVPLTDATRGLVGDDLLSRMKARSLLVNTARGAVVDVDALARGLDRGRPGTAALDVLPDEPRIPEALAGRDAVVITPHVAFSSTASVLELRTRATEDMVRALQGVNPRDGYRVRGASR